MKSRLSLDFVWWESIPLTRDKTHPSLETEAETEFNYKEPTQQLAVQEFKKFSTYLDVKPWSSLKIEVVKL